MARSARSWGALLALAWLQLGASEECVRCPACLLPQAANIAQGCLNQTARVRVHKDIRGNRPNVAERYVWYCAAADAYFTMPPLSTAELDILYSTYKGQANAGHAARRAVSQVEYITKWSQNTLRLPKGAVVVEAGCSHGFLISALRAPDRKLICFEPGAAFWHAAQARMNGTGGGTATVVRSMFNPSNATALPGGIDLFVSSHVLEHVGDLCTFLKQLFKLMKPGGVVFTEVPNHTPSYVRGPLGGTFHLSLPTPTSLNAYFFSAGFRLIDIQLTDAQDHVHGNGFHIRALHVKPALIKTRGNRAQLTYSKEGVFNDR
jgi:SAM-dependent methyltransferase